MTFSDPDVWFAGLPGVVVTAGALITDPQGQVLLVKPNYRELWALPGGICEFGEAPHEGCGREVAEELGITSAVGRLLAVDWSQPFGDDARPIMHFVFDGGELADDQQIVVQQAELDGYRFVPVADLPRYLPGFGLRRVNGALRARGCGTTVYLPHDAG